MNEAKVREIVAAWAEALPPDFPYIEGKLDALIRALVDVECDECAEKDVMLRRWKSAVEGLTPNGSEYVDDPEACAAAIRQRTRWPKQIIEARARITELEAQLAREKQT